jgi:hypothetical protein
MRGVGGGSHREFIAPRVPMMTAHRFSRSTTVASAGLIPLEYFGPAVVTIHARPCCL